MKTNRVLVTGAAGLVGSAVCRALGSAGIPYQAATRQDADLTKREQVDHLVEMQDFDCIVVAAAKVGGIHANDTYPATFLLDNLMIESNLIDSAHQHTIDRLIFLGSSCIYPKDAKQPIREEALLTGPLEPTNEPYAIAKIAGIKLCESYNRQFGTDFRCLMPSNLYGPGDNFHPTDSHVIPALIDRFHRAKVDGDEYVTVWGSGSPRREFLHVDDLATATLRVMTIEKEEYHRSIDSRCSHINIGSGSDTTIAQLATLIKTTVGYEGGIRYDSTKPDGTPRKLLNVQRIQKLGWQTKIDLASGLRQTYDWYLTKCGALRS